MERVGELSAEQVPTRDDKAIVGILVEAAD
jgi:hypothetical protein